MKIVIKDIKNTEFVEVCKEGEEVETYILEYMSPKQILLATLKKLNLTDKLLGNFLLIEDKN